jgi:hypothetical protein
VNPAVRLDDGKKSARSLGGAIVSFSRTDNEDERDIR